MIIYLYGADSYRRNKKLRDLVSEYREKQKEPDFLFVDFEEDEEGFLKVKKFLEQPSIFTNSKLAVIKENGAIDSKSEKEWIKILKSRSEDDKTFILISDKGEPKKAFQFLLDKPVQAQAFNELKESLLEFFLKTEAEKLGVVFEPDAWKFFVSRVDSGEDKSWLALNELGKIALTNLADSKNGVSRADLKSLLQSSFKENVFSAAKNLLRGGNLGENLALVEKLFLQKEEPVYVFNSLAYQASGKNAARLADYDISVKSGGLGYEEAITDFVLGL